MSVLVEEREAVPDERLTKLASLCRGKFSHTALADAESTHVLSVQKDGQVAAILLLDLEPYDSPAGTSVLRFVCANEKGTGLPQILLRKAESLAREAKKTALALELESLDPKLIGVYTAVGFSQDPTDPYRMTKSLPKAGSRGKTQRRRTRGRRKRSHRPM